MNLPNLPLVMAATMGLFGACSTDEAAPRSDLSDTPLVADPDNPTQAELHSISDHCEAPREWLYLEGGELRFEPSNDDYAAAACVLTQINELISTRYGFVGNYHDPADPEKGQ